MRAIRAVGQEVRLAPRWKPSHRAAAQALAIDVARDLRVPLLPRGAGTSQCGQTTGAALVIDTVFGCLAMVIQLAFLDLAAKACPRRVEATFFALLMSVFNGGTQLSQVTGGYLYDWLGYVPLIFISAGMTALAWPLVPLVKIDQIEAQAKAAGLSDEAAAAMGLQAIIVMPDGDAGFYANATTPADWDACQKAGNPFSMGREGPETFCVKRAAYEDYIVKDLVGHVDADREGPAAGVLDLLDHVGAGGFVEVEHGDREAVLGQAAGDGGADAAGGTGHDRDAGSGGVGHARTSRGVGDSAGTSAAGPSAHTSASSGPRWRCAHAWARTSPTSASPPRYQNTPLIPHIVSAPPPG